MVDENTKHDVPVQLQLRSCVNEVLYFIQNAVNTLPRMDIIQICNNFYDDDEILFAKSVLWNKCEVETRKNNRNGQDKRSLNISDMYDIIKKINWNLYPIRFASINAAKVPPFDANRCDLSVIKQDLLELRKINKVIQSMQTELTSVKQDIREIKTQSGEANMRNANMMDQLMTNSKEPPSLRDIVKKPKQKNVSYKPSNEDKERKSSTINPVNSWTKVTHKKNKIIGNNNVDSIKDVKPRITRLLHVTRLDPCATENELLDYLKDKKVTVDSVEKLKARHDSYASFKVKIVSHSLEKFDMLYQEDFWPSEVVVRRYFESNKHYGSKT